MAYPVIVFGPTDIDPPVRPRLLTPAGAAPEPELCADHIEPWIAEMWESQYDSAGDLTQPHAWIYSWRLDTAG